MQAGAEGADRDRAPPVLAVGRDGEGQRGACGLGSGHGVTADAKREMERALAAAKDQNAIAHR